MKTSQSTPQLLVTSSNNILPYIEYCDRHGIQWRSIANKCGIQPQMLSTEHWLPTNEVLKFIHQIELVHGKKIGVNVGRLATVSLLSPNIERLIQTVETLEDAIHVLVTEIISLSNHVTIWTEFKNGEWWLCHHSCYRHSNIGVEQAEWFRTSALIKYCQQYLGEQWQPSKTKLISSQPRDSDLIKQYPNSSITFNHEYGAVNIPLSEDFRPLPIHQAQLDWFESIEKLVETYALLPWFSIEWFGEMLGMSKRTLQRNLKSQSLAFKELKEAARFKKAKELLVQTELSVQEISWQVGYTDLSNFNRAFKKWANMTAPTYRRNMTGSD
ncbi:AraC family transcriptional regulator [Vibrio makurazakiensis]|uniref:helix-turn-helix domain-containing protein n=1 Tax=Vibrio makurazakiensis TaxID=2910250 RepID=UPI003D1252E0